MKNTTRKSIVKRLGHLVNQVIDLTELCKYPNVESITKDRINYTILNSTHYTKILLQKTEESLMAAFSEMIEYAKQGPDGTDFRAHCLFELQRVVSKKTRKSRSSRKGRKPFLKVLKPWKAPKASLKE